MIHTDNGTTVDSTQTPTIAPVQPGSYVTYEHEQVASLQAVTNSEETVQPFTTVEIVSENTVSDNPPAIDPEIFVVEIAEKPFSFNTGSINADQLTNDPKIVSESYQAKPIQTTKPVHTANPTKPYNKQAPKPKPKHKKKKEVSLEPLKHIKDVWHDRVISGIKNPFPVNKFVTSALKKRPEVILPAMDGVSHLNTSATARTELGKLLDLNSNSKFVHPDLGQFACLGGLWYWLCGDQDDKLRTLCGSKLRYECRGYKTHQVEGFHTIIAEATWYKVIQNQKIIDLMIASDSEMPFKCYYLHTDLHSAIVHKNNSWYMPILEEIRSVLKKNNDILTAGVTNGKTISPDDLITPNFDFVKK